MKAEILEALSAIYHKIESFNEGDTKKYPDIEIGIPDPYDEINTIKFNPICYYIPVGDGLYRPTMDRRIFNAAVCKVIASYEDHNIGEQLNTLLKAGYQVYDLCLALKFNIKELNSLRYLSDDSIPPYIRQAWEHCFGIHCSWHPVQQHKDKEKKAIIQRVFQEDTTILHKDRIKRDTSHITKQKKEKSSTSKKQEPEEIMPSHISLPSTKLTANSILIPYQENFDPEVYLEQHKPDPQQIPVFIKMAPKVRGKATSYLVKSSFKSMVNNSFPTHTFQTPPELMSWIAKRSIPLKCFFKAFDITVLGFKVLTFPKSWNKLNEYFGRELVAIEAKKYKHRKKIEPKYNKEAFIAACKKAKQDALFQYVTTKDLLPILKTCDFSVHGFINDIGISQNALKGEHSFNRILLKVNEYLGFEFFSNVSKKEAPKQVPLTTSSSPNSDSSEKDEDEVKGKIRHYFLLKDKNSIRDMTSVIEAAEILHIPKGVFCKILNISNNMLYNEKKYPNSSLPPVIAHRLNELVGKKVALSLMRCNKSTR